MSIWATMLSFSDVYETGYDLDTARGGYFDVAHARSWLDGLRFSVESPEQPTEGECVLDRAQVRALADTLQQWLETEPA